MHSDIRDIVDELVRSDSSLENDRERLSAAMERIRSLRPDTEFDDGFRAALKDRLLAEFPVRRNSTDFVFRIFGTLFAGASVAFAAYAVSVSLFGNPLAPVSEPASAPAPIAYVPSGAPVKDSARTSPAPEISVSESAQDVPSEGRSERSAAGFRDDSATRAPSVPTNADTPVSGAKSEPDVPPPAASDSRGESPTTAQPNVARFESEALFAYRKPLPAEAFGPLSSASRGAVSVSDEFAASGRSFKASPGNDAASDSDAGVSSLAAPFSAMSSDPGPSVSEIPVPSLPVLPDRLPVFRVLDASDVPSSSGAESSSRLDGFPIFSGNGIAVSVEAAGFETSEYAVETDVGILRSAILRRLADFGVTGTGAALATPERAYVLTVAPDAEGVGRKYLVPAWSFDILKAESSFPNRIVVPVLRDSANPSDR